MDKLISVGFEFSTTVVLALRSTAIDTFAIFPSVLDALVDDISLRPERLSYIFRNMRVMAAWIYALMRKVSSILWTEAHKQWHQRTGKY